MTVEADLLAIEGDREMPEGLRARVERALVERTWAEEPPRELADVATPRVMPSSLEARLHGSITGEAKRVLEDADAPRPLPPLLRSRLERTLAPAAHRREVAVRALSIAAGLMLLASSSVAVLRGGEDEGAPGRSPVAGGAPIPPATIEPSMPGAEPDTAALLPPSGFAVGDFLAEPASGPGIGSAGEAPPFAYGDMVAGRIEPPGYREPPPPVPSRPFTLATVGKNEEQSAGFSAYLGLLNARGGVAGVHRLRTVHVESPHSAPDGAMAIVNLSSVGSRTPVTSLSAPYLETLATAESALNGDVFSMGGAPERQARLAVQALFPNRADGSTAVIYRPSEGIFATSIADAFQDALEARGVHVLHVEVTDSRPLVPIPADAAFLSLPTASIERWAAEAARAEYRPARGVGGIFSLGAAGAAGELPPGTVVASPYALDLSGGEVRELLDRSGEELSAELIHGWVTAKALAIAMWRAQVEQVDDMPRAMERLRGWDLNFAPAYGTRAGSNVRAPDALVHELKDGKFVRRGGWRTDRS